MFALRLIVLLLVAQVVATDDCDGKLAAYVQEEWKDGLKMGFKVISSERGLQPGTEIKMRFAETCQCSQAFNVLANFSNSGSRASVTTQFLDYNFAFICKKPDDTNGLQQCSPLAYSIDGVRCSADAISRSTCRELGWQNHPGGFGEYEVCASSRRLMERPSCLPKTATFAEAEEECTRMGARLCTQAELRNDEAKDTGCGYNSLRVWSSVSCQGSGHLSLSGSSNAFGTHPTLCSFPQESLAVRCCADREEVVRTRNVTVEESDEETLVPTEQRSRDFDLRINCGGAPYAGFVGDSVNFFDKATFSFAVPVGTQSLDEVFSSARYQRREPLIYRIPLVEGLYNVTLGFAELFADKQQVGSRLIDVEVGSVEAEDFQGETSIDVYGLVGLGTLSKTFLNVRVSSKLFVQVSPRLGNAFINSIEISSQIRDAGSAGDLDQEILPEIIAVDISKTFQEIDGIGGSIGWYHDWLFGHSNQNELLSLIFKELQISVLRLRNEFGRKPSAPAGLAETGPWLVTQARKMGVDPRILLTSWSPPGNLKANNALRGNGNGATLRKDVDGQFVYDAFADYWVSSLVEYGKQDVFPTWISIQNEPNFDPAWEGCAFDSSESTDLPSYGRAWTAVYNKTRNLPQAPLLIGPEVTGIGHGLLQRYVDAMPDKSSLAAISHHLYGEPFAGGEGGYWLDPPSYLQEMREIHEYAAKLNLRIYQTELASLDDRDESDPIRLAWMMHNAFVVEGVAMYLHWDLVWGADDATLIRIENPFVNRSASYEVFQSYYAFKQFSAFVGRGWVRVESSTSTDSLKVSAYVSPDASELSVILINVDLESIDFRLTGTPNRSAEMFLTDRNELKCNMSQVVQPNDTVTVPGQTIATIAYR